MRNEESENLWVRDQLEYQYLMCEGGGLVSLEKEG